MHRTEDGSNVVEIERCNHRLVLCGTDRVFAELAPSCPPQNVLHVVTKKLRLYGYRIDRIVR